MPIVEIYGQDVEFPDDLSDDALNAAVRSAASQLAPKKTTSAAPAIPTPASAALSSVGQSLTNLGAGAARGAGSIGSTILSPADALADTIFGNLPSGQSRNESRRAGIDQGLMSMVGADPSSGLYQTGKIGAEVAGTLGVGPAIGGALLKAAPGWAPLAGAISTGGMGAAPIPARMLGGAITGAASAGLADPSNAGLGAAVGGALPAVPPVAGAVARKAGGLASEVLGLGTGAGGESIRQAAMAGREGGARAASFTANMRGNAPMSDALDIAKANLDAMRAAKSAQYRSGMVDITSDKSVIDFADVDSALSNAANVTLYKGQVKNAKAESVRADIAKAVDEWKSLDPAEYHTPEGFDALKQRIGAIVESIPMEERTAGKVGKDIYNAVKDAINKQAPTYAKVMKDYSQAADDIAQAEKALSLGKKASVDTAMRKLQSLTRNNVNTNYGNRLAIAEQLQREGGQDFMPALAGQSLSSITPRGLSGLVASGAGAAGFMSGGLPGAAAALPVLAAQSPRIVGEAAYGVGKAARAGGSLMDMLLQSRAAPVSTASLLDYFANQ